VTVSLTAYGVYWILKQQLLERAHWRMTVVAVILCVLLFSLSGIKLGYTMRRVYGRSLSAFDVITLPVVMNLWGYLLPIKGGMLYSLFYMHRRYGVAFHQGGAISFFVYAVTLGLAGLMLLVSLHFEGGDHGVAVAIGLLLVFNYVLIMAALWLIARLARSLPWEALRRIGDNLAALQGGLRAALVDPVLVFGVMSVSAVHFVVYVAWYMVASTAIGIDLPWRLYLLMAIAGQVSIVFRILPGNLGVSEASVGAATLIFNGSFAQGVEIAVVVRLVNLLVTTIVGIPVLAKHMMQFDIRSCRAFRKQFGGGG